MAAGNGSPRAMAEGASARTHKLARLREFTEAMRAIETERLAASIDGADPACGRAAAQQALTEVVRFCQDQGIESGPLIPLLADLAALTQGAMPSALLAPRPLPHRRPDPPLIESTKGRLAAVMAYRQATGSTRKEAAEWVARNLPAVLATQVGQVSPAAVDAWLLKWGGSKGAMPGPGRAGYFTMEQILASRQPDEAALRRMLPELARWLPARQSR